MGGPVPLKPVSLGVFRPSASYVCVLTGYEDEGRERGTRDVCVLRVDGTWHVCVIRCNTIQASSGTGHYLGPCGYLTYAQGAI
eukprot:2823111-Prymnesium_polylepis.1